MQMFGDLHFVEIHNKSTIKPSDHVTPLWLLDFNERHETILRNRSILRPLRWLREDVKYLHKNPILWSPTAFESIFLELRPEDVDFVLVDGGFCGFLDTQKILGARYIALDDINDPKNYDSFNFLQSDKNYELIDSNLAYRNGYAIFRRI